MRIAKQMQAYVRTSARNRDIELTDMPVPEAGDGEVLVQVEAFGVGIHDSYYVPDDVDFPYVIGTEAAGVIVRTGNGVLDYQAGDRVILNSAMQAKGGCWAEYVVVSESELYSLPAEMDFTAGAAFLIAGKTALESMRALELGSGDILFVAGASGAIGTLVIQLATAKGIRVIGSASQRNHDYILSLGAESAVDYSDPNWQRAVGQWCHGGVSAALAIQPNTAADSMAVVRDGGRVITVSGDQIKSERHIEVAQIEHREDTRHAVNDLLTDIADERILLVIEGVYPFADALDALRKTETRHARGKVVVDLERDSWNEWD